MDDDQTEEEAIDEPDVGYLDEPDEVEDVLDDRPMKVYDGLYIGSMMAEMNKNSLLRAGITDVLQVAQGLYPHHPLVFNYMNIQVQDMPSEDLVRYFPKCFEYIDRAISKGGAVLVHCAAGVSRSATVILGHMMSRYSMTLTAAVEHLKEIRPWVQPNTGFLQQLETYQSISYDMTRWRAWQVVWQEQQQQHQNDQLPQQQQQQQHWVQISQVHSNGNCNSSSSSPAKHLNGVSSNSSSSLQAVTAAAVPQHGSSLDPARNSSSSSSSSRCCCVACCGIGRCFVGGLHPSISGSGDAGISLQHFAAVTAAVTAPAGVQQQQQCQDSSNRWSSQFRYSSSAPECRSQTIAAAACAAAGAAGDLLFSDAAAELDSYAANGFAAAAASRMGFASGSHISSCCNSAGNGAAVMGVQTLEPTLRSAGSNSSCMRNGLGVSFNSQQQQQDTGQRLDPKPHRRQVAFAMDTAPATVATGAGGAAGDDATMEEAGGYFSVR